MVDRFSTEKRREFVVKKTGEVQNLLTLASRYACTSLISPYYYFVICKSFMKYRQKKFIRRVFRMWYNVIAVAFSSFSLYIRLAKTFLYRLSCFIDMLAISWVVLHYPVIWFECKRQCYSYFDLVLNRLFLNWLLLHWFLYKVLGNVGSGNLWWLFTLFWDRFDSKLISALKVIWLS